MGLRNFQRPFSVLDKIASQPHTITLSGRLGIGYPDDRQAACTGWRVPEGSGPLAGPLATPSAPAGTPLACDTFPRVLRPGHRQRISHSELERGWEVPEAAWSDWTLMLTLCDHALGGGDTHGHQEWSTPQLSARLCGEAGGVS